MLEYGYFVFGMDSVKKKKKESHIEEETDHCENI